MNSLHNAYRSPKHLIFHVPHGIVLFCTLIIFGAGGHLIFEIQHAGRTPSVPLIVPIVFAVITWVSTLLMVYERWYSPRAYYKSYMFVDLSLLAGYAASVGLLWYMGQVECFHLRSQSGSLRAELEAGMGSVSPLSSLANIDKVTCTEIMAIYAISWINTICLVFSAFWSFKRRNTLHEKTRG